jgi:hypothetical protein
VRRSWASEDCGWKQIRIEFGLALVYFARVHAMRLWLFLLLGLAWPALNSQAASTKIIKALPHFLDREGRHSLSPSLYDRDAYQAFLRRSPKERSGLRFDVQWKAYSSDELKLRVEMRGAQQKEATTAILEGPVRQTGLFSKWTSLKLAGEDYKQFGELVAWRATLWDGGKLLAEQKSFLW